MEQNNIILEGVHYGTRKVIRVGIRGGYIYSLTDMDQAYWPGGETRPRLPVVAPGLVDLQINGFMGVDFNSPGLTAGQLESIAPALLMNGVTSCYPTLITGPRKRISSVLRTFLEVDRTRGLASRLIGGIHLEGPFISREDGPRGAHPRRYCLDPDIDLLKGWQEEAEGHIRIVTLAPELPGSEAFIRACREMGIVVAIGHTAAGSDDIRRAVDAGASLSTHLGNGCHATLPRHPNYLWDQLADERLYASMIADGFHLPDAVLRVFILAKNRNAVLISDGMPYTGLKPGLYDSPAAGPIRLTPEGKLHREGKPGLLAGSAGTLLGGVTKIAGMEGFARAWEMGSIHPSRLMNQASRHGIQVGAPADLVLLDPDLERMKILQVFKNGVNRTSGNGT